MPKFTAEETKKREDWVTLLFTKDPSLSQPEAYKLIKKEFKSGMRPMRIYELRNEVLKKMGIKKDKHGNPLLPEGSFSEQANRKEGEPERKPIEIPKPLEGRCIVPVEDVGDAVSFQQKLNLMNAHGFISPKIKVEAASDSYLILAHEK